MLILLMSYQDPTGMGFFYLTLSRSLLNFLRNWILLEKGMPKGIPPVDFFFFNPLPLPF